MEKEIMEKSEEQEMLEQWFFDKLKKTFTPGEIKMVIDEYKQMKKDLANGKIKYDDSVSGCFVPVEDK